MDLQLGRAIKIVMQTTPYLVYRAMVYGALCGCGILYLCVLGLIGYVFGSTAFYVLLIVSLGLGAVAGLGRLLGEYVLYVLKAGHVALITEIATNGNLPTGASQTLWAKDRVMAYFKEVSVLSLIDQLVKGIIKAVNRTLLNVMTILPIPGSEGAANVAGRIVDLSLTYVDEAVLAYTFKTKNENVFDAATSAIVLYCQSWKGLLKNAVALTILSYVFVLVAAVIFMLPLGLVALILPPHWATAKFALFVIALLLGIACKHILFDPIACTSTILTFLRESESLTPDAEWEARIESVSDKFKELKEKAAERFRGTSGGAAPSSSPGEAEMEDGPKAENEEDSL